nr:hypothetical protein [Streptomyces sp. Wb2n-11]
MARASPWTPAPQVIASATSATRDRRRYGPRRWTRVRRTPTTGASTVARASRGAAEVCVYPAASMTAAAAAGAAPGGPRVRRHHGPGAAASTVTG